MPAGQSPGKLFIIGITGGVGSGKTTVARILADFGAIVLDADREAKKALRDPAVRKAVRRDFGDGVFASDGRLLKKRLAARVFAKRAELRRLERSIHPYVFRAFDEKLAKLRSGTRPHVAVIDAPLLDATRYLKKCDVVLYVDSNREVRAARLARARAWRDEEIKRRDACQTPVDTKKKNADFIIENHGSLKALKSRVGNILRQLVRTDPRAGEALNIGP